MKKFKIRYSYNLHVDAITKEIFFSNLSDAFLFLEKSYELFDILEGPILGPILQEFKNNIWKDWKTEDGFTANYILENGHVDEGLFLFPDNGNQGLVPEIGERVLIYTKLGETGLERIHKRNENGHVLNGNFKYWRNI
ncbi:MAG: hypothetical protein PHG15_03725 [Acinetobacter sp.]|uniref:hypothetical protein n=1 Tax=Acinetobacter sp. TaxID=472 RepID=UPI00261F3073|nr:hypothetical protein [Acinetobacter sp.]MDD2944921.1 hypothetical protein [Acinetobacter sp.]